MEDAGSLCIGSVNSTDVLCQAVEKQAPFPEWKRAKKMDLIISKSYLVDCRVSSSSPTVTQDWSHRYNIVSTSSVLDAV